MTEAVGKAARTSWRATIWSARHDPWARILNVDLVTALIAILLPWTTTGVSIAVVLWIVALGFTCEPGALLRSLKRPVSALPIAFFALVLLGMLWSHAPSHERLHQLSQVSKLLMLPLLIYHFQRSPRGMWVFVAFLISCLLVAAASCLTAINPNLSLKLLFSASG